MKRSLALGALAVLSILMVWSCDRNADSASSPEVVIIDDAARAQAAREREEAANPDYNVVLEGLLPAGGAILQWKVRPDAVAADATSFDTVAGSVEGADRVRAYGLTAYRRVELEDPAAKEPPLQVEIFRMNKLMGAFGLYASYREPTYAFEDKGYGNQAFVHQNRLLLWNSHFVVRATRKGGPDDPEKASETLLAFGKELASRVREKEPPILPRHLRIFPGTDVVTNTQRYAVTPFLELPFLEPAVSADYARPEGLLTAFILIHEDDEKAADAFHRLVEHFREGEAILDEYLGVGAESFRAEVPDHGRGVFVLQKSFIVGALGLEGDSIASDLLQGFVANIDGLFWKPTEPPASGN